MSIISVSYRPLGPLDISPVVFQNEIFWGLVSLLQVPWVEVPDMGMSPHFSGRSSGFMTSLPTVDCHTWVGFFWRPGDWQTTSLSSLRVLTWSFYSLLWRRSPASFRVFSWGSNSICNCIFGVSVGGGKFRIFLHHHFGPHPPQESFNWVFCE